MLFVMADASLIIQACGSMPAQAQMVGAPTDFHRLSAEAADGVCRFAPDRPVMPEAA